MAQWLRVLPQKTWELEFGFHINTGYGHMCTCELTIPAEKEKKKKCAWGLLNASLASG